MHDFFFAHYGLDWAAATFLFLSMWRLGGHHRDGFLFGAASAVFWILFNARVESAAGITANAIILGMSLVSFARFKRPAPSPPPSSP
jgi:3-oxoacyl-(acyl-carrier-protein) synthase